MDGNSCQMAFPSSSALAHDWIASLALPTGARPGVHDTKNISTHKQKTSRLHLGNLSSFTRHCRHTHLTATPLSETRLQQCPEPARNPHGPPSTHSPRPSSPTTRSMEDASDHHHGRAHLTSPPPPPNPNAEVPSANAHSDNQLSDEPVVIENPAWDITTLSALGALRTLQLALESLSEAAADVPPTPPISRPVTPTHGKSVDENVPPPAFIGADADPHHVQHAAIARRFFSKHPPPFSISAYLARQHAYCPHSPGVYLTAAHYIHRLCTVDRILPATNRTVHRLSLAATRIAAKALEDNKWSQQRVAQVGGVSPTQLLNLEVALCFLLDFELGVDAAGLAKSMFGLQMAGRR